MERKISPKISELYKRYLASSVIRIGNTAELLLVATLTYHRKTIAVHSDKGFEHLVLLLCEAIIDSVEIKAELKNTKYLYPISVTADNPIEKMMVGSYVTLSLEEGEYIVTVQRTCVPSLYSLPGIYVKTAREETLESAFETLVNTEFLLAEKV